jgi:hypothetical protein
VGDAYIEILRNTRLRFGEPPRQFASSEMSYLKVSPPSWCKKGKDDLFEFYRDFMMLMRHGRVVWGNLVQANNILFAAGAQDAPGSVVYCKEPYWHDELRRLAEIGTQLTALKEGSGNSPQEKQIGRWLADEMTRFVAHPVPTTLAGDAPVLTGCLMFIRKHLPGGVLSTSYFPLLVHDEIRTVAVLPARFWDGAMVDIWMSPR